MCLTNRELNDTTISNVLKKYDINPKEYSDLTMELFPNLSKDSYINTLIPPMK